MLHNRIPDAGEDLKWMIKWRGKGAVLAHIWLSEGKRGNTGSNISDIGNGFVVCISRRSSKEVGRMFACQRATGTQV